MILKAAEQVLISELRPCAAFYLENPINDDVPMYRGEPLPPDTEVWIKYTSEGQRRSMLNSGECRKVGALTGLRAVAEAVGINYYDGYGGFTK